MKTRTLYTEYVGYNPNDKKEIDYARVYATDIVNSPWLYTVGLVLPVEDDDLFTDWYADEDNYLTKHGLK